MNTLVWLRNDLRWHDNPLLIEAFETNKPCYFLYILDHELLRSTEDEIMDFNRIGEHRLRFLKESFDSFDSGLKSQQNKLVFKIGNPLQVIQNFIDEYSISDLIISEQFACEEINHNKGLIELFGSMTGIKMVNTATLFSQEQLPFDIHNLPHTFSAFNRKTENLLPGNLCQSQELIFKVPAKNPPVSDLWPEIHSSGKSKEGQFTFYGSELNALERLNNYLFTTKNINNYKNFRNGLIGYNFSSRFSPWLANGSLSSSAAYHAISKFEDQHEKNEGTQALKYELRWREFFYWNAKKQGDKLFHKNGFNGSYSIGEANFEKFETWRKAQTNEPFINAGITELNLTGWLSNRARQNIASFLIHDLNIDWRWGASWFEHKLIDYDAAINWGNWAYIAGVGNDPQAVRKFNIRKQQEWYDPENSYTKLWTEI